ncbi:hypothetical protein SS42_21000 [Enterobacter hormaechei subsp. xiangfangensis]|nr:hypothetical protein LI65_024925 [Enterobacter hormaechei subsp. steigerwaltii]KJL51208.1 hypothetical protein SS57_21905 [Enterobacter hormaechei subsp. xiangfangensis]KJN51389.1 hypothetical protein SS43_21950 [Enterobacter asburiae]KJM71215.1 hypothetical protein SS28_20825 [Enterobacter hormaechei subsp. steigerwaltii]KJM99436.1 hypothetical protein SS42_21000 [Enterobacter hormaechei subsp. xiangfangensis]
MHRVCAYVQYRQMFGICIYRAYADGEYMRMPYLCRCQAYGYALHILSFHFSRSDPKKGSSGSRRFSALICETKIKNVLHFK